MGHSQSYDLRNPEPIETKNGDTVRGVRRISKEHESQTIFYDQENFDYREDDLREKIRNEQLKKRQEELDTLRIRQHENREPIIDAYRQPSSHPTDKEFNHYDSLKHHPAIDPETYHKLHRRHDVKKVEFVAIPDNEPLIVRVAEKPPIIVTPPPPAPRQKDIQRHVGYPQHHVFKGQLSPLHRQQEVPQNVFVPFETMEYRPVSAAQHHYDVVDDLFEEEEPKKIPEGYPKAFVYSGRTSPLPRHPEVEPSPMPRYVPQMSDSYTPKYDYVPSADVEEDDEEEEIRHPNLNHYQHSRNPSSGFTSISEIRAEKRMVVGVDTFEDIPPQPHVISSNRIVISVAKNPDFPLYSAKMRQSSPSIEISEERLYRQNEEKEVPIILRPAQTSYGTLTTKKEQQPHRATTTNYNNNIVNEKKHMETKSQQTQYQSPVEPQCNVKYCTHIHVPDQPTNHFVGTQTETNSPYGTLEIDKENRVTILVDEKELDNVIDLARDDEIGPMTTHQERNKTIFEEKLFYHPYLPTLSLNKRPLVGYYDKLH